MIHINKYICTAADDMHFRGGITTRGTSFKCRTCDKNAFQIKGVIDELEGEHRAAFLQALKARHAEHAKACTPQTAAVEESEEEAAEVVSVPLDPSKIATWTASDVEQFVGSHQVPARIIPDKCVPGEKYRGNDFYACSLSNEHGSVRLLISETILALRHPEVYRQAVQLRDTKIREALVNKCVSAAIKSVLDKARDRHFRSAKGKLARVLGEMHKPPPNAPMAPPKQTVPDHPMFKSRRRTLVLKEVPRPAYLLGEYDPSGDDYSSEHGLACILPYLLHPLKADDIEALSAQLAALGDTPTSAPSALLGGVAQCSSNKCKKSKGTLLVKPVATRAWLATAWALASVNGVTPVRLATTRAYPADIERNTSGFVEVKSGLLLTPVEPGLLCAVLGDVDSGVVDPIRALALGWVE